MIIIFSFNREEPLLKLLKELKGKDHIHVIDDGSDYGYSKHAEHCTYHRLPHRGKRGFWQNWDFAFDLCRKSTSDRFVFLPDDWKNVDTESIYNTFGRLPHPFASNITNVGWSRSWTPIRKIPSDYEGFYKVGWVDHGLICPRQTLEILDYKMEPVGSSHLKENGSSGVGKQLSTRLWKSGIPMFTPVKSMAEHQGIPSQMHPDRSIDLKPQ